MVNWNANHADISESPYAQYLDHLRCGEIMYQKCNSCMSSIFYPRTLCPKCGSEDLHMSVSTGRGKVYASTNVIPREGDIFNVVLVDLDEEIRVMSTLVPSPAKDPIGLEVQLSVDPAELKTIATLVEHGGAV